MKKIWVQKTSSFQEAERFDERFWRSAGAAARFSATWSLVGDYFKLRGKSRGQPRLRRTVQRVEFIKTKRASGRLQDKPDLAKLLKRKRSDYR